MSQKKDTECCPPSAPPPKVPNPVAATGSYRPTGKFEAVGDFKEVYTTGPDDAEHALIVIYDIFGFWETTLRGSDLLASHLLLVNPHKIYMPDVFKGKPFPPEKDGDKDTLNTFFSGTAKLDDRLPEVVKFAEELKKKYKTVSILGYCWGGKLTLLALADANGPFTAGAAVHPAMIANSDGDNLAKPLGFYPSKGEPGDVVQHIAHAMLQKPFHDKCDFHLYNTVHHGWAAARANLDDPESSKQFDDVYQRVADYLALVDK